MRMQRNVCSWASRLTSLLVPVALISTYIPNRVTQSVLLHPIRKNISATVQQLVDVASRQGLSIDVQKVLDEPLLQQMRCVSVASCAGVSLLFYALSCRWSGSCRPCNACSQIE